MFKRLALAVFVMVLSGFFLSKDSLADRRSYVWTYEYLTMPKGETELEYYLDFKEKELNDKTTSAWKHQLEIEHGLTDRWDMSIYQVFSQENGEPLKYEELKLRTRYRLSKAETEVEYAVGLSYQFSPSLKIGLEGKGDLGESRNSKHYLSPVISLASGKLWISLWTAFGLTSKSDDFQFRYILGL